MEKRDHQIKSTVVSRGNGCLFDAVCFGPGINLTGTAAGSDGAITGGKSAGNTEDIPGLDQREPFDLAGAARGPERFPGRQRDLDPVAFD